MKYTNEEKVKILEDCFETLTKNQYIDWFDNSQDVQDILNQMLYLKPERVIPMWDSLVSKTEGYARISEYKERMFSEVVGRVFVILSGNTKFELIENDFLNNSHLVNIVFEVSSYNFIVYRSLGSLISHRLKNHDFKTADRYLTFAYNNKEKMKEKSFGLFLEEIIGCYNSDICYGESNSDENNSNKADFFIGVHIFYWINRIDDGLEKENAQKALSDVFQENMKLIKFLGEI